MQRLTPRPDTVKDGSPVLGGPGARRGRPHVRVLVSLAVLALALLATGCATTGKAGGVDAPDLIILIVIALLIGAAILIKLGAFLSRLILALSALLDQVLRLARAALLIGILILVAVLIANA
jgi:hypothetical protein